MRRRPAALLMRLKVCEHWWATNFSVRSALGWSSHRTCCHRARTASAASASWSGREAKTRVRRAVPRLKGLPRLTALWCVGGVVALSRAALMGPSSFFLTQDKLLGVLAPLLPPNDAEDYGLRTLQWHERGHAGAIEATVAVLKADVPSAVLQERGCKVLCKLVTDEAKRGEAGAAGAIEALTAAMQAHTASAEVLQAACLALRSLASLHLDNKVKAAAAGAIEAVVAAMQAHPASAEVQQCASQALAGLADDYRTDNRSKAGAAGALESLVAAMQAHPASADVQCAVCKALSWLTFNLENKNKAGKVGVIETAVAALRAHPANAQVQEAACSVIGNATHINKINQAKAGALGASEAAVTAMLLHPSSQGVHYAACSALKHLTEEGNSGNVAKARTAGAVDAANRAMQKYAGTSFVVERAQEVLAALS